MTDQRLQEAFVKDAARRANSLMTRALSALESVSRATGDHRFDLVIPEIKQVRDRTAEVAEVTDGPLQAG